MSNKVIYKAEALVYGAKYKLTINDIPFAMDFTGAPLNSEIPLNEFLTNNLSAVAIELIPLTNEEKLGRNAEVKLVIKKYDVGLKPGIGNIIFEHIKETGSIESKPIYKFATRVDIELPYVNPKWLSNKTLNLSDNKNVQKLNQAFEKLWTLFSQKNATEILASFSTKFSEYEKCYYLENGNRFNATERKLNEVFSDNDFKLNRFSLLQFKPSIFAGGRVVSLIDDEAYNYIMYYNFEKRILVQFPIYLGINSNEEIIVCL